MVLITLNSFQTWQEELVLQSNKKSWFYKEEEKQSRKSLEWEPNKMYEAKYSNRPQLTSGWRQSAAMTQIKRNRTSLSLQTISCQTSTFRII